MHAPLGVPERQLVCSELINALNECHAQGMLYRWAGMCNVEKQALTLCLRKEVSKSLMIVYVLGRSVLIYPCRE